MSELLRGREAPWDFPAVKLRQSADPIQKQNILCLAYQSKPPDSEGVGLNAPNIFADVMSDDYKRLWSMELDNVKVYENLEVSSSQSA